MKNIDKQNTDQEKGDSFLNERQDVTCSGGEAVTELSPSSGSDKFRVGFDGELYEKGVWWWKTGWFDPKKGNCPDWWYEDDPSWSKN